MGIVWWIRHLGLRRGLKGWRMTRALRVRAVENEQALAHGAAAGAVMPTANEVPLNRAQRRAIKRKAGRR